MIIIKKFRPLFTGIVTTMNTYTKDEKDANGLIVRQKGNLKEFQKVVAVGDSVRNMKVGDLVAINPSRYAVRKHQEGSMKDGIISDNPVIKYNFNIVEASGVPYLLLQDRDIDYVIEDWEESNDIGTVNLNTANMA